MYILFLESEFLPFLSLAAHIPIYSGLKEFSCLSVVFDFYLQSSDKDNESLYIRSHFNTIVKCLNNSEINIPETTYRECFIPVLLFLV